MAYDIHFVDDDALPAGQDFLFMFGNDGDGMTVFLRRSAIDPRNLEDAWAAYRALSSRALVGAGSLP